jgi:DNA polymerase-3 subunit epsilon
MRGSTDVCGCFPTGRHYPGIADRMRSATTRVAGMAHGFAPDAIWSEEPFVVLDFETTGLDAETDRIIEIGAACFRHGKLESSKFWLVHPGIPIPPETTEITGIDDSMVAGQPPFEVAIRDVISHLEGRIPVAYNHFFDSRFLWAETRRAGLPTRGPGADGKEIAPAFSDDGVWIDPLVWARELQKNDKGHKLVDVCARLGIPLESAHRASHDAEAAGHVLLALASQMPRRYAELLRVQQRYAATQDLDMAGWRAKR